MQHALRCDYSPTAGLGNHDTAEQLTRPRSSSPAVTTMDRPMMECGPISLTMRSSKCTLHTPASSASMFPVRSRTKNERRMTPPRAKKRTECFVSEASEVFVLSSRISASEACSGSRRCLRLSRTGHTGHDGKPEPQSAFFICRAPVDTLSRNYIHSYIRSSFSSTVGKKQSLARILFVERSRTKFHRHRLVCISRSCCTAATYMAWSEKLLFDQEVKNETSTPSRLTQVPDHSVLVVWSAVILAERVEDASRTYQTLGKVPKNVNADSVSALKVTKVFRIRRMFPSAAKRRAWLVRSKEDDGGWPNTTVLWPESRQRALLQLPGCVLVPLASSWPARTRGVVHVVKIIGLGIDERNAYEKDTTAQ